MNLDELLEETVEYANVLIDVAAAQASAADLGKLTSDIARHYRAMGIYDLLMHADVDGFRYGLTSSALTRYHYLDRCSREGVIDDPERVASFLDPYFDAVACDHSHLAAEIARLSPTKWKEGFEYKDDFEWAMLAFALGADADPADTLERYAESLEGAPTQRLEVARALAERDQAAFDDAFWDLIDAEKARTEALADPEQDSIPAQEYTFEANRWIFVEGLALLKLAERRGLSTEREYDRCPDIARRSAPRPFVPESYPNIPLP